MDVLVRLDEARATTNVLEHRFYERWSAGALDAAELSLYADQYRHAVVALAQASARAAQLAGDEHRGALRRHATEEIEHVALWDQFAGAARTRALEDHAGDRTGIGGANGASECARTGTERAKGASKSPRTGIEGAAETLEQTRRCASAWTQGEDLLEHSRCCTRSRQASRRSRAPS